MKKAIVALDSFKGTASSKQLCDIVGKKIAEYFPDAKVVRIPIADGGEGTVDCLVPVLNGKMIRTTAKNPYFEDVTACYGITGDGKTAIIEAASVIGLPLIENRKNPSKTTSYGVGQLVLKAASAGCTRIIVGLGGSSTNDAGCGAAAAAGIRFFSKDNRAFIPTGETLCNISSIDFSQMSPLIKDIEIRAICDINNPLYGRNGAAYVFAPQKGADAAMVKMLDRNLEHFSRVLEKTTAIDYSKMSGGGAAGGLGAGLAAFFNAELKMGIDVILDAVNFEAEVADSDMVVTGEGKLDGQSLGGKVVIGIARRARLHGCPVIAVVGGADYDIHSVYKEGVTAVFPINRLPQDLSLLKERTLENVEFTMDNIMRMMADFSKLERKR